MLKSMGLKIISLLLLICVCVAICAGCTSDYTPPEGTRVAMIATSADITDRSYNETIYVACKEFCEENNVPFMYYRAPDDTTDSFMSVIDAAINDDYNVVVLNSFNAVSAIRTATKVNNNTKFIAMDVQKNDFGTNFDIPDNLVCCAFQENLAGFMAGYAAVKEGYHHLGFVGGISLLPVQRYGYGYIKGADTAAKELNVDVTLEYVYANQFFGDADVTAYIDTWYDTKNVEVVFSCAGAAWTSVASAAKSSNKKMIGVDNDQKAEINEYTGQETAVTSAVKGLSVATKDLLQGIKDDKWNEFSGQNFSLGIVNEDDPSLNYVQLPMDSWSMKNFTIDDYKTLVKSLYDGEIDATVDTSSFPQTTITVNDAGNIK